MRCLPVSIIVVAALAVAALVVPRASAATRTCPGDGTPPPGSTVNGGLEITGGNGYCELHNVTVYGGINVDPTSDAKLSQLLWNGVDLFGSRVFGGIVVGRNSQADSNADFSGPAIGPDRTTINGGLTLNHALQGYMLNVTITGAVRVNGNGTPSIFCVALGLPPDPCWVNHVWCEATVNGNVSLTDVNSNQDFLGDPEEQFFVNSNCTGNTIHGSVQMTDSNFTRPTDGEPSEIEGETVTGSVILNHSTLELSGNTIGGSLLCVNGTVIHPPAPEDNVGNTVRGRDTCD